MAIHRTDIKGWILEISREQGPNATRESVLAEMERRHGRALQTSRYRTIWQQTAASCAAELRSEGLLKPGADQWEAA
jgi:hypothetical protein